MDVSAFVLGEEKTEKNCKWPALHESILYNRGLSRRTTRCPAEVQESRWFQTLPLREREILGFGLVLTSGRPDVLSLDLSQSMDRGISMGKEGNLPTIIPKNVVWLPHRNRLLLGREGLAIQGFDTSALDDAKKKDYEAYDRDLMDLAGNAFSLPVVLSILVATFVTLDVAGGRTTTSVEGRAPHDQLLGVLAESD